MVGVASNVCMFTDGSDPDIHAQIAREDAEQVEYRPGLYYLLVKPWGVYTKEAQYFIDQFGLVEKWGLRWRGPFQADSIAAADTLGKTMEPDKG